MQPGSAVPTYYRRPLPEPLVPFASSAGRRLFQEALAAGGMEGWFALAEQFHTQSDPAFCGLGTLVVVLNALQIDPGRIWKGPWRWYSEELLDCCLPLEQVQQQGVTLQELACLARCNGATARVNHGSADNMDDFRTAVRRAAAAAAGPVVVVGYARDVLGQTGTGHYSPVAGYHAERDLVLVLDVARFKYPPHWVPLSLLWQAMQPIDPSSGKPRGWIELARNPIPSALIFRISGQDDPERLGRLLFEEFPAALTPQDRASPEAFMLALRINFVDAITPWIANVMGDPGRLTAEHRLEIQAVLAELRATQAYALAVHCVGASQAEIALADGLAIVLLSLPHSLLESWGAPPLSLVRTLPESASKLAAEVSALREQWATLKILSQRKRGICP